MTYWLLTTEYPPFYGGGISTYCGITAAMLAGEGHAVTVFIADNSVGTFVVSSDAGVRLVRFKPDADKYSAFLGHATEVSYAFAEIVRTFIEKEGAPDVIEAQEYQGIAYFLLQYKRLLYDWCKTIPVVITLHSPAWLYLQYNHAPVYKYPFFWIGEMERFCLQAADLVISPSQYMLDEVRREFGLTNPNCIVVPNPFQVKNIVDVKGAESVLEKDLVFFGKLSVQKGSIQLLDNFEKLWQQGFAWPLHLVGGQDIFYYPEGRVMGDVVRNRYRDRIEEGKVILEESLPPQELARRMKAAAVVIIPSIKDNLPYVVMEMMALGKIVLVSKSGGQAEIVSHGVDGFVFDHDLPESFGQCLRTILQLSKEEKENITTAAKKKVESLYNPQTIYAKKMAELQRLLQQPQTPQQFPFARNWTHTPIVHTKDNELLSVVIPFYNMGAYLPQTMDSLQQSAYAPLEIIIVNDGSTGTGDLEVLNKYRSQKNVRIIDQDNKGLGAARNRGAAEAGGTYLAFLDADDLVAPDYYSKAINVLASYENVHFAGCWAQYFEGSTDLWPTFNPEPPIILHFNTTNSSGLVYKRETFLASGFNDSTMPFAGMEDYDSVLSLLKSGYRGICLPEPLFKYRVRKNSMIRGINATKKLQLVNGIAQKHKAIYATFAPDLAALLNANGPGLHLDNPTLDYHLTDRFPVGGKWVWRLAKAVKKHPAAKRILYRMYKAIKR